MPRSWLPRALYSSCGNPGTQDHASCVPHSNKMKLGYLSLCSLCHPTKQTLGGNSPLSDSERGESVLTFVKRGQRNPFSPQDSSTRWCRKAARQRLHNTSWVVLGLGGGNRPAHWYYLVRRRKPTRADPPRSAAETLPVADFSRIVRSKSITCNLHLPDSGWCKSK